MAYAEHMHASSWLFGGLDSVRGYLNVFVQHSWEHPDGFCAIPMLRPAAWWLTKGTVLILRKLTKIEVVEGSLLGLAIVAAVILICEPFFPRLIHPAREALMPTLVCALLIHVWNFSVTMRQTSEGYAQSLDELNAVVRATTVRTFANQAEFCVYVRSRFAVASRVQVTHFSSHSVSERNAEYREIVDGLIRRGGKYYRFICDSLGLEIWQDQQEWVTKYAGSQFFLQYLENVAVDNMKLVDIMVIDDDEVCLGGGYQNGFDFPIVSIRNEDIVRFYQDYFRHLAERAVRITATSDELKRLQTRKRLMWQRSVGPRHNVAKIDD